MPIAARLKGIIEAAMTDELVEELAEARPDLPHELDDRAQDSWEALFAIADHAGGHWPVTARSSAVALATGRDGDESSLAHRLLVDTRTVFEELAPDETRLNTGALIADLVSIPDSPWGDLRGKPITGRTVKRLLGEYEISPFHSGDFRGYRRADFSDGWARYASQSVQSVQSGSQSGIPAFPKVSGNSSADTLDTPGFPLNHAGSDTTDTLNRDSQGHDWTAHGVVPLNHAVSGDSIPDVAHHQQDEQLLDRARVLSAEIRAEMRARGYPGSDVESLNRVLDAHLQEVVDQIDPEGSVESLEHMLEAARSLDVDGAA